MNEQERLARLETQFTERWTAHDKHAEERQAAILGRFDDLGEKITKLFDLAENRPCKVHEERFNAIFKVFGCVWSVIVIIIAAVVGVWVKK